MSQDVFKSINTNFWQYAPVSSSTKTSSTTTHSATPTTTVKGYGSYGSYGSYQGKREAAPEPAAQFDYKDYGGKLGP